VEKAKEDIHQFENMLFDFVSKLEREGKAPSYIDNYITCVKSWLRFNGIILVRKIKVGNTSRTPTIEDERVPQKDELRQILNLSPSRGKVSICLMAFSGVRPQVLGNEDGSDGLEIRDLSELVINGKQVEFDKIPTLITVRSELSKAKHKYLTFLGAEGCEYLKTYLESRLAEGEKLEPSSPIIAYKKGYGDTGYRETNRDNMHITRKTVTKEIRTAMRPKYKWRPYVLRAYFDTQLMVAENNGKITHSYRQFFMGHKGDMEAKYTTNKGRLPESVIEDMRSAYKRSLEYLETRKTEIGDDKLKEAMRRQLLLVAGFSGEEIDNLDTSMSDEEFQETIRKRLIGTMVNNGNPQKVIQTKEISHYLDNGWSFVAKIDEDQAIVKSF